MNMRETLRILFRKLTPAEVAARELGEAELSLLTASTGKEYAQSLIDYNDARIKRLRKFLASFDRVEA
jgi:hypothetical protein